MKKNPFHFTVIIFFTLLLVIIFLVGCQDTADQTQESCDASVESSYLELPQNKPGKFIVILIDNSENYYPYTQSSINIVEKEIVPYLEIGDRILVSWMGPNSKASSIIVDKQISSLPYPQLSSTLTPVVFTPTPQIAGSTSVQDKLRYQAEQIDIYNAQTLQRYLCEIEKINRERKETINQYYNDSDKVLEDGKRDIVSTLESAKKTPASYGNTVYEDLSFFSSLIQSDILKKQFSDYYLIIFSDLVDSRKEKPSNIDFSGMNLVVFTEECPYTSVCNVESKWSDQFKTANSLSAVFLVREDKTSETFKKILSK